ncbi:hypothetical protein CONLIGDRAFT_675553 [Coniochaeta ligniaria NRRL 30616]|uniref:BTB domain-containing protein n=1 Tax=Coniochaeta ligniaria NRRL 30616 TaxID=1408157 RepID=A0A1J7JWX8_9PEZI|nr:hypothetical protein CONLIGDRAFT_675553 [Coniochaeta ligniaria NRRL 30616]
MNPPRKRQGAVYANSLDGESAHDDSGSETAETGTTVPRVQKKESKHVKIMKNLYGGGGGSISVSFGDDETIYDFPKTLLTKNFLYFRLALGTQSGEAKYAEGENQKVHFEDIDVKTFATLHKWVAIAADYLGLDHYQELEVFLNQGLALSILTDRRVLTQRVLDLVTSHEAFKSQLFRNTVVKAGVRPALQEHMLGLEDKKAGSSPGYGQKDGYEAWDAVLKHCRRLRARKRNIEYAADVLREITATLMAGGKRGQRLGGLENGALLYRDPLRDVYEEEPYSTGDVDHDFTM